MYIYIHIYIDIYIYILPCRMRTNRDARIHACCVIESCYLFKT